MHNFDKLILITQSPSSAQGLTEFDDWMKSQGKGVDVEIEQKLIKFQKEEKNIFIMGSAFTYDDEDDLVITWEQGSADEKTILAVHFGEDTDKSGEIYKKLGKINQQRRSAGEQELHIGVIIKYSLRVDRGYPEGISNEYKKIKNASSTKEDVAKAFESIFNRFQKEAIKKKYDERIDEIIEIQFPISSLLGLIKFKSSKMIDEMIKRLQNAIKEAMPSESIFQEINSSAQYMANNNLPKESKLENWLDKLNCIKNNLIAEKRTR